MKKALLLILIIFLSSCAKIEVQLCNPPYFEYKSGECCLDKNNDKICDVDEKKEEKKADEITEPTEDLITLKQGESTLIYNKEVLLEEFISLDNKLDIELLIDNQKFLFSETKKPEINQNFEIQIQSIDPLKRTATFKIKKSELKENEYILYVNKPVNIKGYDIILENVDIRDNTAVYSIKKADKIVKDGRLRVGYSLEVENIKMTNIKTFFHDQRADRYGLFRIE